MLQNVAVAEHNSKVVEWQSAAIVSSNSFDDFANCLLQALRITASFQRRVTSGYVKSIRYIF
jgi:major membrane immunogen (membrane-anchored lipoprotein)